MKLTKLHNAIQFTAQAARVGVYRTGYWAGYQIGKWTYYFGDRTMVKEWCLFITFIFMAGVCIGTLVSALLEKLF